MADSAPPFRLAEKIPRTLRLPVAAFLSFALSTILRTLLADVFGAELASISRPNTAAWHIGVMFAWKASELAVAWKACYDHFDLACLTLLNQVPHYFLLNTFYGVNAFSALIPLVIDIVSVALPFWLLRGLNHGHQQAAIKTPNQQVVQDRSVQYLTALFGSAIYAIVVYGSFQTWLPVYMVIHFDGVKSLEKVHSTVLPVLFGLFGPVGYAVTQFIFVPAIGSTKNPGLTDPKVVSKTARFDAETASFTRTVAHNIGLGPGGLTPRAEIIAKRTALLAGYTLVNTFVRAYATVEGTELIGSIGWATVWATAAGLTGLAYAWVGDE